MGASAQLADCLNGLLGSGWLLNFFFLVDDESFFKCWSSHGGLVFFRYLLFFVALANLNCDRVNVHSRFLRKFNLLDFFFTPEFG